MSTSILATKLYIPPVRPEWVPRPRLVERLDAGLRLGHKLTLVSAPAGSGKTTLLSEWAQQSEWPAAWLSLDEGDNDPVRFLAYLIAALQTIKPKMGEGVLHALQSPQPPEIEAVMVALINALAGVPNRFALVLDDYHVVEAEAIHDALAFLLDHSPPQIHLVIATRLDPPLNVARLRGRGQVTELRQTDLRFTPDQVTQFLNETMGLQLSADQVTALAARTEGWIAGLQMAAVSMQRRDDVTGFVRAFSGSNRYILDYLIEEVLSQQPEGTRDFLLQTAILSRLSGSLCDAVTGRDDGQATLERLDQANLFIVPLDEQRHWYRYHHLFGNVLLHYLERQAEKRDILSLHQRACSWLAQHEFLEEALEQALAAEDYEQAATLVGQNGPMLLRHGQASTLLRWMEALPAGLVSSQPGLGTLFAWALSVNLQFGDVEPYLQDAERALLKMPDPQAAGRLAAIRAMLARIQGDAAGAIELFRQALDALRQDESAPRGVVTVDLGRAFMQSDDPVAAMDTFAEAIALGQASGDMYSVLYGIWHLAEVQATLGHPHQAAETYRQALHVAGERTQEGKPILPVAGMAYAGLSGLHREWNELDAAARYALEAVELGQRSGFADSLLHGCITAARVRQSQGDWSAADELLQEAERIVYRTKIPQSTAGIAAERARLWLRQLQLGRDNRLLHAVARWVASSTLSDDWQQPGPTIFLPNHPPDFEHLTLARAFIVQERFDEAQRLLAWLLEAAAAVGRARSIAEIQVLQALTRGAQGRIEPAMTALQQALSLGAPVGYVRLFVDEGLPMAGLLRQAVARGIAPGYAGELLSAFEASERPALPTSPSVSSLIEPLSDREREVLQLIAAGRSNREAAEQLFIATSTIKKHLENIYGKLEVHSRTEAVARARELNLM